MIDNKKCPRGAIAPVEIIYDGLFKLDVDDDIWQDIGLTDEDENNSIIPGWLGDENIRTGMKALVELERCLEEERRLKAEVVSMHQWFREEWAVVNKALDWSRNDPKLILQLEERKRYLLRLGYNWLPKVQIAGADIQEPWGPSEEEWSSVKKYEENESVLYSDDYITDEDSEMALSEEELVGGSDDGIDGIHDAELIDGLEHLVV